MLSSRHHIGSFATRPRRLGILAGGLVATAALLAGLSGFGAANAATRTHAIPNTTGPTVYEQSAINQSISVKDFNEHTILVTSPVLSEGTYQVNSEVSFNNLTAGSKVLCGWNTTESGDAGYSGYGQVENEAATPTIGSCTNTGTVKINNLADKLQLWVTVFTGPLGPSADSWSMNETPVGKAVVSSQS
jgi:hypothetical protein